MTDATNYVGRYKLPLHISCGASIIGHILYACAYKANWLYLILLGRIVSGLAFSMYVETTSSIPTWARPHLFRGGCTASDTVLTGE